MRPQINPPVGHRTYWVIILVAIPTFALAWHSIDKGSDPISAGTGAAIVAGVFIAGQVTKSVKGGKSETP